MAAASGLERAIDERLSGEGLEVGLCVLHVETGAELAIGADAVFPAASTFKVPLVVEVFRRADAGALDLDERIALQERHKTLAAGVLQRLSPGLAPTVRDLAVLATIVSDNTAAEMLVERIGGAKAFDAALKGLGMAGTHYAFGAHGMFLRGWGLPPETPLAELARTAATRPWDLASPAFERTPRNTVSTARDMAGLMARLARGEAASPEACRAVLEIMGHQQIRDRIPQRLPYGQVANKTGALGGVRADVGLMRLAQGRGRAAFAFYSFDATPLPGGNSDRLIERNVSVNAAFADVGKLLWDRFAEGSA